MHRARFSGRISDTSSSNESLRVQHQLAPGKQTLTERLAAVEARPGEAAAGPSALPPDAVALSPAVVPSSRSTGVKLEALFGRPGVQHARGDAVPEPAVDHAGVHAAAAQGISSPASALPHGDA